MVEADTRPYAKAFKSPTKTQKRPVTRQPLSAMRFVTL
jgi:hypothetical protein